MPLRPARELDILATAGWLAETPAGFREAVLERCRLKRFRRGDAVYRTGDPAGGLYGLIAGGVAVELSPADREPYVGTFAWPGFWIGEGSVLTRGPRLIGIRATRASTFAYLPLPEWDAIARSDPEAWRWFALLGLRNAQLALAVVDALMVPGAAERLAAILLVLAGWNGTGGRAMPIEVSQDTLARMANLSRSSTGRILQAFEADGLVENAYRQIRVTDEAGLRRARGSRRPDGGTAPGERQ